MIKKIIFMVAVVAISTSVFGQVQFGVKAGANLANMTWETSGVKVTPDMLFGFELGGLASVGINEKLSFQPELLFAQYGAKVDDVKFQENLISIPLMFKYSLSPVNIVAGPQLGYLLSAKMDGEDAMDGMKKIDMGIAFGIGYEMENGLGLDARYYLGLANIADDSDVTVKNKSIQIAVYYKFK